MTVTRAQVGAADPDVGTDAAAPAPPSAGRSRPAWAAGLTEDEAARRLRDEGWNELPGRDRRSFLAIAVGVMREPMFLMLVAAGTVYMVLGDLQEALMLLGFVVVVIGITLSQERKTERALDALRDLASPRALVVRDGTARRVAGREVARGDLVVLSEGDRVPADGVVVERADLAVDESLLTGESVPVDKSVADAFVEPARPGGDDTPFAYSGTLVVRGHGLMLVTATGPATEMGRIGGALRDIAPERTALQREVSRLVQVLALAGAGLCSVVVVGYGLGHGDWLRGVLAGLALAMAMLPEEFPVILTVFLALGAWRLSKQSVLTRRVPAIEALGAATVLCVDKTGTLTENRMAVAALWADGTAVTVDTEHAPEGAHAEVARTAALASLDEPYDPMERAIRALAGHLPAGPGLRPVAERPPVAGRLLMTRLWAASDGTGVLACKGAPEAVLPLCRGADPAAAEAAAAVLAGRGLRVLAVAGAVLPVAGDAVPEDVPLHLLGMLALADPVRRDVPAAVAACRRAGVRVVMVTGDHPGTAMAVAAEAGLRTAAGALLGPQMEAMDDAALRERLRETDVVARVMPEQKLRIVRALQAGGEVVAMTGDGVNDAPALRAAGIGIAMGGRGADVAREAAALVLLDDDVTAMVDAVRGGRRIVDNLRNAMTYALAIHVPIAGLSLVPVLLGWPLVLMPVQIVFLELIIDPACSVVFEAEAEAPRIMERPPRDPSKPLISRRLVGRGVAQGLCVLVVLALTLVAAHLRGTGPDETRALVFAGLVVANLGLILVNRSPSRTMVATLRTRNRALWWVVGTAGALLAVMLTVAPVRSLFRLGHPSPALALSGIAVGALAVVMLELWKVLAGRRREAAPERGV